MREDDRDDLELHRSLAAGDRGAFDALYRRYSSSAYGLAYRITGQQVLAQDVVHDAFMALWRAPEAFDPARGAFRTFFLSLVHHRAVDTVRREERIRARQERASNLEPVTVEDPAEGVIDAADLADRRIEVRAALETLSAGTATGARDGVLRRQDAGADRRGDRRPARHREDQDPRGDAQAATGSLEQAEAST